VKQGYVPASEAIPVVSVGDAELHAARKGWTFCRKVNDKSGINAAATVLTDAGLLRATAEGYIDHITCFYVHLSTDEDWCEFEIGVTENADGSGDFTAFTPKFRVQAGADRFSTGVAADMVPFHPPITIRASDGGAWTIRAQTNDAGATITFGLNGWREREQD